MKKKIILIIFISCSCLGMFLIFWRYFDLPPGCMSNETIYKKESPDVLKSLSPNDLSAIVEYIRDHVIEKSHLSGQVKYPDFRVYVGYRSSQPSFNYRKAWELKSGVTTEISEGEYLRALHAPPSSDLPQHVYSMYFISVQNNAACVAVENRFNMGITKNSRGGDLYTWVLKKNLFGTWESMIELLDANYD